MCPEVNKAKLYYRGATATKNCFNLFYLIDLLQKAAAVE